MKITLAWCKKIIISDRPFQRFITTFLLSLDWSLSSKLQLIDLITVFAAFLVGRQTILVSFFSRERRNRKETNGWKNKSATGRYRYTSHVLSVKLFAQYLRMQLKNDFFLHLFNIGWPCKHYNFQMRLHDNLVPRMLEMAFQSLTAPCSYSRLLFSNQLPTSNFIETPAQLNFWASLPQTEQTLLSGTCCLHTWNPQHQCTAASFATAQATSTSVQHKTLCKCEPWPKQLTPSRYQSKV